MKFGERMRGKEKYVEVLADPSRCDADSRIGRELDALLRECRELGAMSDGQDARRTVHLSYLGMRNGIPPKGGKRRGTGVRISSLLTDNTSLDEADLISAIKKSKDGPNGFAEAVYDMMKAHNMTAADVYTNAKMRRQDFSRSVHPNTTSVSRHIAWQVIIGLHCSTAEATVVFNSAGYCYRPDSALDIVISYFIKARMYNIYVINNWLAWAGTKTFSCYEADTGRDDI